MSIETLKRDFQAIVTSAKALSPLTAATTDVIELINNNLFPWLENVVDELDEIDGSVDELVNDAPEILHTESAAKILAVIAGASILVDQLRTRVGNDVQLLRAIKEWQTGAKAAQQLLEEITIPDAPDEEEDDDDDDRNPEAAAPAPANEEKPK